MKVISVLLPLLLASGCNLDDEKVFKSTGNSEKKPVQTLLNGTEGLKGLGATQDVKTAATVTYLMKVTSESGVAVCNGEATIKIMTNFSMTFPKAEIACLSLTVNLGKALDTGGAALGGGDGADAVSTITHDGKVLSLKTLAGTDFDPPRPMLLGPIVQDPSIYKNFKQTTQHTLSGKDAETGAAISGTGSFKINVLDEKTTYKNNFIDEEFENILHWEITSSGFKDIPARSGLVFDRMEWLWNTRPIMIPKLSITGRLSDFISGDAGANADMLLGTLKIDLTVKEYKIEKD
jgi:hypothetical protein